MDHSTDFPATSRPLHDLSVSEITSDMNESQLPLTDGRKTYENGVFHPLEAAAGSYIGPAAPSRILIGAAVSFPGYDRMAFRGYKSEAVRVHAMHPKKEAPYRSFYTVMPRYESLSREQFAFYLTWRESARRGEYTQVDFGYLYLYLYELLNLLGHLPPADILSSLLALWKLYRKDFPMLDRQLGDWVLDLCLIWNLPLPIDEMIDFYTDSETKTLPLAAVCAVVDGLLTGRIPLNSSRKEFLLRRFCTYRFRQNRHYKENRYFSARMEEACTLLLPRLIAQNALLPPQSSAPMKVTRFAFAGAVISAEMRRTLTLDCYTNWGEESMSLTLGNCIKSLDNGVRSACGIRARLSGIHLPDPIARTVLDISSRFRAHEDEPIPTFEKKRTAAVDLAAAHQMENEAWETTRMLTAHMIEDAPPLPPPPSPTPSSGFAALSASESAFLCALAHGDKSAAREIARKNALFPAALADSINEKLADDYGEPILDEQGVFEEYTDEILSLFKTEREPK